MNEWKIRPLGDLTINLDSKRVPVKEADRKPGPYPYYGASGIVDFIDSYIFEGLNLLVAEDGENLRTRKTPIAFLADGKYWVNNHAHIIHGNKYADTRFLCYALQCADISGYLTGAVMPKLTQGNLNRIPIIAPPLHEQKSIASILGALDDKIDCNRRMNETLEAMARAMFKDWFVDFGPTKAKMEGRAPYLAPEIWDLFPDRLDDEGKPEGWGLLTVGEILELAYGKSLPVQNRLPGEVSVYGSGGLTGTHNEALVRGPVVIVGRKGTVGSLYWVDGPVFPIDTVFYVKPKTCSLLACYQILQSFPLANMNTDAAVPGLNRNNVYRLIFAWPGDRLFEHYNRIVTPLWSQRSNNIKEYNALAQTRDLLLPKLMSGEIRVRDAERAVEDVL
jgi:type I restriction enzyme S subunit